MASRVEDLLCKALEIIESNAAFYREAIGKCESGPGKEVFETLRDDAGAQVARIHDIYEKVKGGESFTGACTVPEEELLPSVKSVVEGKGPVNACQSELGAVNTGMERTTEAIRFFEGWAAGAEDGVERRFAERMVQESRGQYMMLSDLQFFYEDPEGFSLRQDDQILDGA
ncbi:hypothetical protein [Desulfohalovibrio reitneri]|uniref:hypothetical protein n=1 Tax=Desulfohalovibrio reitneri TaxID=1307759 RepID=UPI0004A70F1E|nr:hypothetical protein [Desulfohalovibrio reitneri]